MIIAVCALTYKRPQGLRRLLEGLGAQYFRGPQPDLRIIVVDNDPEASGRMTCDSIADGLRWPIEYVVEPMRGIAHARNTALDRASAAEWLCFIDDDEVPGPAWLDELICAQRRYEADVVGGPVEPYFPNPVPQWMRTGRFFEYNRHASGTLLPYAFTNNVLFRAAILSEMNIRFDARWALMGCEDRHFFQQVRMAGYKIVWSDEAVVTEWIPESRTTVRWILQRGFRYGTTASCVELDLRPGARTRLRLLAIAGYRLLKGLLFLPLTWPFGIHLAVTYLRHACFGAGVLAGWCGMRYDEYRATHGD